MGAEQYVVKLQLSGAESPPAKCRDWLDGKALSNTGRCVRQHARKRGDPTGSRCAHRSS